MQEMQETPVWSLSWEDPRGGNGNPLQYSCLENSIDSRAWQATVHGVTKLEGSHFLIWKHYKATMGFPGGASGKEPSCQCRRHKRCRFNPWVRKPGAGHGNPLQYSCLENPRDGAAWWAAVLWITKSQARLKQFSTHAAAAKSLQLCSTLFDPIDGSPPGSPIPGILQARTLEWVAFSFSSTWKWKVKVKSLSRVRLLATPWTVAYQGPPSMGFARQEYWSGAPLPSPPLLSSYG